MYLKYIILLFLFITPSIYCQFDIKVNVNVSNNKNPNDIHSLGFGVDPDATDLIDSHLGEIELPPKPPVFYTGMEFVDSSYIDNNGVKYYDIIYTNLDLRGIPADKDKWYVKYKLFIVWDNSKTVKIAWNDGVKSEHIDSIFIKDVFNGVAINYDMRKTSEIILDNDAIDELYFHVYYTKTPNSVDYSNDKISNSYIQPNMIFDNFEIVNISYDYFKIINNIGSVIFLGNDKSSINNLNTGLYFIQFYKNNQLTATDKFFKFWELEINNEIKTGKWNN